MRRGAIAAVAALAAILAVSVAQAQQSRKDICDGDLKTEEQRIKTRALAQEKQAVDETARTASVDRLPQLRAAIARNMAFELSQAKQNYEDCLKLP